jgi:hypothetical protein
VAVAVAVMPLVALVVAAEAEMGLLETTRQALVTQIPVAVAVGSNATRAKVMVGREL